MKQILKNRIFVITVVLAGLFSVPAFAAQPLSFSGTISAIEWSSVAPHLNGAQEDYLFSKVDLNGDGLDEVAAVSANCKSQQLSRCEYFIFGRGAQKAYILLQEEAWNITVSDQRAYGLRKIMVYKSPNNQFKPTAYTWNALKSSYTDSEGDKQT